MDKIRIVFPEMENEIIREALAQAGSQITPVAATSLEEACQLVNQGSADALIAGIDYTSREVILACKNHLGMRDQTFSASFVFSKGQKTEYVIGDAAACKSPTAEQLYEITLQTYQTAKAVLTEEPRLAILSFSTLGSGGEHESIARAKAVLECIHTAHPEIQIDGEMQLDAAVSERVAAKKAPNSPVAGRANVFIMPDLNAGNILYKAIEYFGGYTAAGPILQGFTHPCSDLSRGSTVADVLSVIEVVSKQVMLERGING